MKKTLITIAVGMFLAVVTGSVYAYQALRGPTELIQYNPAKAYNGYTLFRSGGDFTWMIDMEGNVVHTWPRTSNPQLLENGNILSGTQEFDWDGNIAWEFDDPREDYRYHHDRVRIFNPKLNAYTTLCIANKSLSIEDCIAAGLDLTDPDKNYNNPSMDAIVEVDMDGNVVWEWWFFDHMVQDYDSTKAKYGVIADNVGKLDINFYTTKINDLIHLNSIDYNPTLDQIVFGGPRNHEIYVINHGGTFMPGDPEGSIALAATEAGDFLWRWGNPQIYDQGEPTSYPPSGNATDGDRQLAGMHDVQWIDDGLPGAGNIMIFNNGGYRPGRVSEILEINPYDGPMQNGVYIPQLNAGTTIDNKGSRHIRNKSNQNIWEFNTQNHDRFAKGMHSWHISGCARLPNGNTIMCAGEDGHFVEVTYGDPQNGVLPEVVWEYINPVTKSGDIVSTLPFDVSNSTFRAYRYGPDYPGLAGKDLTPKGTITGRPPVTVEQLVAAGTANMTLSHQLTAVAEAGWVEISGTALLGETPLCIMVLANGEYMFTDAADGEYELVVPLDESGQITLFGFGDGFAPFTQTFDGGI